MSDTDFVDDIPLDSVCCRPCHPSRRCEDCSDYWHRMIMDGYWDKDREQWTDKAWREMTK